MIDRVRDPQRPIGFVVDVNSGGRFDLVVYREGLVGLRGTYLGVAIRAAGVGMVGAGGVGAAVGASAATTFEDKRLRGLLHGSLDQILGADPANFFVDQAMIESIVVRKRWYNCCLWLTVRDCERRKFEWKPALNNFGVVESCLRDAFGGRVSRE